MSLALMFVVVGLLALITAPRAAATGVIGTILGGVGFAALLLCTRHSRTRSAVLLSMVVGILGLATVAVSAALYHPQWRPAVGVVLAAAAAVVVEVEPGFHEGDHGIRGRVRAVHHGLEEADPVRMPVQRVSQSECDERLAGSRRGRTDINSLGHDPPFAPVSVQHTDSY